MAGSKASPKSKLSCDISAERAKLPAKPADLTLGAADSRGTFIGGTVTLPANVVITLSGDLTIIARNLLDLQGTIEFGNRAAGQAPRTLTLICTGGPANVHHVSGGFAAPGAARALTVLPADAEGKAGQNAGYVKVWGVSIDIDLEIRGDRGGDGGNATADNSAGGGWLQAIRAFLFGLPAEATGGQGGYGGDVMLCAVETIRLYDVIGGSGGEGGYAEATADTDGTATALGGSGNDGGDVTITGVGTQPVRVRIDDRLQSGRGDWGGYARAIGGPGGGFANATGGNGGNGGKIVFNNAVVTLNGTVEMGRGDIGLNAAAWGGVGDSKPNRGGRGGNAKADGGTGGSAAAPVKIPLPPPAAPVLATPGSHGSGGDADATPGDGGNSTAATGAGGPSGSAKATGGANGGGVGAVGGTPGPTKPTPPAGATGGAGASAAATQNGTL